MGGSACKGAHIAQAKKSANKVGGYTKQRSAEQRVHQRQVGVGFLHQPV